MSSDIKPGPIYSGPGAKPGTYSDETPAPLDPSKGQGGRHGGISRLVVTDDATYEQRPAGTSNAGGMLTEVRTVWFHPDLQEYVPCAPAPEWTLLDPSQAEPRVGDRWTLRHAHGRYTLTAIVNGIVGDLA